jgi:NADH-quinone oxidoreductase subunit K
MVSTTHVSRRPWSIEGEKKAVCMDIVKYVAVSMILFLLGIWGIFLNRKNIIVMLMSIELMLLAVNVNFLVFSVALDDIMGQVFALLVLTVAAAESAIGLALLVVYYRVRGTIAVEFINLLKG